MQMSAMRHLQCSGEENLLIVSALNASLAQLAEHALRERTVVGSIPTGGYGICAVRMHAM